MNRLKIILDITNNSHNRLRSSYIKKNYELIYLDIINYSKMLDIPFKQKIWHWVNEIDKYQKCYCGNNLSFNMNWLDGYKLFCSNKCSSNSDIVKEKLRKTNLEKYGVDHYSKTDEFVEKIITTSKDRYGVSNYSKTEDYLIKSKKTNLEKYGVTHYSKTEDYLIKSKKTNLEKYGVTHYSKTDKFKLSFEKTMMNKYNNINIKANDIFRKNNFKISNDINYIKYLENSINLFKCDNNKEHFFEINTDNYYGRKDSGNKLCTICNPISSQISLKENEIFNYINDIYNEDIIQSYRDTFEIDIYLPKLKIGIEFNGIWWHSDKYKDKEYHIKKTEYFEKKEIKIIHIWEDDWIYKKDIIKSQIKNLISLSNKIYARKCIIKKVDKEECFKFLNDNHIQGRSNSNIKIGLYFNDEIVSLMTFDKLEGRKKLTETEWNINRFCNIKNHMVIGGASKILNYFIKEYNPSRIISYADRDWSVGNLYLKLGFKELYKSKPDYKYIVNNKRVHKSNFKKSITKTKLTESKYTESLGIQKVYDCGKIKFELLLEKD